MQQAGFFCIAGGVSEILYIAAGQATHFGVELPVLGGAHGFVTENCLNFDLKTGRTLSLADIVSDSTGFKKVVEAIFRAEYAKDEFGKPVAKLTDAGFMEDNFILPANYMITPKGLALVWGQYEIASYAMGMQNIEIPYAALKGMLRNELIGQ